MVCAIRKSTELFGEDKIEISSENASLRKKTRKYNHKKLDEAKSQPFQKKVDRERTDLEKGNAIDKSLNKK